MIAITVDGHALAAPAILERGRLMLPLRATAQALGASVAFDPVLKNVVVRRYERSVVLHPQIRRGRSFVPLRTIAEALGAAVAYDARRHAVAVRMPVLAAAAPQRLQIGSLTPADGQSVPTAYPAISATLSGGQATLNRVHLLVDGLEVTPAATFDGTTITYLPRAGLTPGTHTVTFSGTTIAQQHFAQTWSFTTTMQAPPDEPAGYYGTYGYEFFSDGPAWYDPGDWMHFTLIAPPGGSAYLQLCGLGYAYPLWNGGNGTAYEARFPAPSGYWIDDCQVTAWYTAWNGQTYMVPYPIFIGIYTMPGRPHRPHHGPGPTPAPQITPTPRPIALPTHEPRRPEPTPAPRHIRPIFAHTPKPLPTPPPVPTPKPVPTAQAVPTPQPLPTRVLPLRTPRPRPT